MGLPCSPSLFWTLKSRAGHWLFISMCALRSPLISYPWIAIALALIWQIFRFAHRSITLKKTVPETCITYLSDACRFLNCSVSSLLCTASSIITYRYFTIPPQDGADRQWTWQIMVLGPGIAFLMFWALKLLHWPTVLGPKIAFYWELLYKKLPIGGVVYMALYCIEYRRLYP